MVNKPRNIGTAGETAVVRVFQSMGWPNAKRHALSGSKDIGDLNVDPRFVVEVKAGEAARSASDGLVAKWLQETEVERVNAGAEFGILVVQRRGIGAANAHRWWAILPLWAILTLRPQASIGLDSRPDPEMLLGSAVSPVRMLLGDAIDLIRGASPQD